MNLNHLHYFRVVARLRHFTRAAEELHVTQPSVSYAIAGLQDELGVRLFEEHGRNVELTKYGRIFLEHVEKALDELDFGALHLQKLVGEQEGRIDIGYVFPLAAHYIPGLVRNFLDAEGNGGKSITFEQGTTPGLIKGLKRQKYDVIFCSYADKEPGLEFHPLLKQDLKLVVPPDHPLAGKKSVELDEMLPYPMILYNEETGLGKLSRRIFAEAGLKPTVISQAENEPALYGLVARRLGISLVADTREIRQFDVCAVSVNNPLCTRYIFMAWLRNHYLSPAVLAFIKYAKSHKGEDEA